MSWCKPDGTFFGVAYQGGANGSGTVFSYRKGDYRPTAIYSFSALQGNPANTSPKNNDGGNPFGGLTLGRDGNLYGTTAFGGANGSGTIFRVTTTGVLTTLYTFSATDVNQQNSDGARPEGKLVQVADGSFFGTTNSGGSSGAGAVFRITAAGAFTSQYAFPGLDSKNSNATGASPVTGLLLATDGILYGVARYGGLNGLGTIFAMSPQGQFRVLHTFSAYSLSNTDGGSPTAALMQARDGNFYGTTSVAGSGGYGTIFRITPAGVFDVLYAFNSNGQGANPFDGYDPDGPLIEGPDGTLYGTASQGGAANVGTVFGLSPSGVYSLMFSFGSDVSAGVVPSGGLIIAADGNLYGSTVGANSFTSVIQGSIFMLLTESTPPLTLTLSPSTIYLGQTFMLSWSSPPGSQCQGFGPPGPDGQPIDSSGSITSSAPGVAGPIAYFLWCQNALLGRATTIAVETFLTPAPQVTITVAPTTISLGNFATVTWTSSNDANCTASGAWSSNLVQNASQAVTPAATGVNVYTVTCENLGGSANASASLTVTAAVKPTVTLSLAANQIAATTGVTTLTWMSTGAPSCAASGAWSGPLPPSSMSDLGNLAAGLYVYTVTCTGPAGSATASATLQVVAPGGSGGGGAISWWMIICLSAIVLAASRKSDENPAFASASIALPK